LPLISITRLRVRSIVYLPQFVWYALRSSRQAQRAPGFLGGKLLREKGGAWWTLTAWQGAAAMNAYRTQRPHVAAMPRLLDWCNEAAVVHWTQVTTALPSWQESHQRMQEEGRASKVNHPSPVHLTHQIPAPRPSRIEARLRPVTP
jgi:hypothetical protein